MEITIPEHTGVCFACSPKGQLVRQPLHTRWHVEQAALNGEISLEKALATQLEE